MENQWTFANLNGRGWIHPTFTEKEDAIAEARKVYPKKDTPYITIGQLKEYHGTFYVENQEYINQIPQQGGISNG